MHTIECKGAPRDLGLDQGAACGQAIASWLDERGIARRRHWIPTVRRLTSGGALGGGVGREVVRHYAHLAERMSGIARAAGVSLDALMEDVVASAYAAEENALSLPAIAVAAGSAAAPLLARSLDDGLPWALRRSTPEVGFASVELTLPWLAGGLAGVNDAGIGAAAATPAVAPRYTGASAAPAWLLVQEALQRFDELDGAIEWCLKRPASGAFGIFLADASGDRALVEFAGETRQLVERGASVAVHGGTTSGQAEVRKQLEAGADVGAAVSESRVVVSLAERSIVARIGDVEESLALA